MKKIILVCLSLIMTFSLFGCQNKAEEQKKFDEFMQQLFVDTLENDYTTMYQLTEKPEDFGINIDDVKVGLGEYITEESIQESRDELNQTFKELSAIDRKLLTEQQQDVYDALKYECELNMKLSDEKFDYYQQLYSSTSGIHYQIPTMLADWELRDEKSVQDFITVIKDVKPYIQSTLEYTKTQAEKGLLMCDIDSIIEYCQGIVDKKEDSSILTSIYTHLDEIHLDDTKNQQYKQQIKDAYIESFIPAYQNIIQTFKTLEKQNNEAGLAQFEYGKEYYELLLQQNIGSNKSVSDVKDMMEDGFNDCVKDMTKAMIKNSEALNILMNGDLPNTTYQSYEQILDDIEKELFNDFPKINNVAYNIQDVNEEIASSSGIAAYFVVPALDSTTPKILRVNPKSSDIPSIDTFKTVAHEGYPGHMYQFAYAYENLMYPYQKALMSSQAYTEGYAVYAEYEAFHYLKDMPEGLLDIYQLNEVASYYMIIQADIGIHYEGWTLDDFKDFFVEQGLDDDEEMLKKQYKQLQANPAIFESYYVGYAEIISLKEKARNELGDKFENKAFHEALLKSGSVPFSIVEKNIDAYIKSVK